MTERRSMSSHTNHDGMGTLHHDLAAATSLHSNNATDGLPEKNRTRSQFNVPDPILRLPLSRSPFKDARRACAKARGTPPIPQTSSRLRTPGSLPSSTMEYREAVTGSSVGMVASPREAIHWITREADFGMDARADAREQRHEEDEGTDDSLFSPSDSRQGLDERPTAYQGQHTVWPTSPKKRASPDTDPMHALSSPDSQRQSKRSKVEAFRTLGLGQEYSEYHEPVRDSDGSSARRSNGYMRASSTKPTPSPNKTTALNFPPRAQSVPLSEENGVRPIDLTSIPPSPLRSSSKTRVEIRRAPSVPLPDGERTGVGLDDTATLLHFTNATQISTPRANPVFRYTVNFATPRGSAKPPRLGLSSVSPLSPLTPLPASPTTEPLFEMRSLLTHKVNARLLAVSKNTGADNDTLTGSVVNPPVADTTTSADIFQSAVHASRPAASASRPAPQSHASDNMRESSAVAFVDLPSDPSSRLERKVKPIPRPTVTSRMKPRQGPSVPLGPRRITRSVSMKERRVKGERAEIEDTTVTSYPTEETVATTSAATGLSEAAAMLPPSATAASEPRVPKLTSTVTSKSRPPLANHRTTSASQLPPDPTKLRQTSLNIFVKPKPSAIPVTPSGSSLVTPSTRTGSSSKIIPPSSSSKLPLPVSPFKRSSTLQTGNSQQSQFSFGSAGTSVWAGTSRETSGRSLTTLSHALDKLVVPPPSRPNTSLGFVGTAGMDGESTPENAKGKWKTKDDTSLPLASTAQGLGTTFTRPTASSLKRAATTTGFGSTAKRMCSRGGAMIRGSGRGRGTIGIFSKAGDRASKKTNLPVVAGSPVKGGAGDLDRGGWGTSKYKLATHLDHEEGAGVTAEEEVSVSQDAVMPDVSANSSMDGVEGAASQKPLPLAAANTGSGIDIDPTSPPISVDKGKQRGAPSSALNPASSALHALSESLSSLPQTPTLPKPRAVGTRTGLRSSSIAGSNESPVLDGSSSGGPGGNIEVHGSGGVGSTNGTVNGSGGAKKSSLKILKRCAVFVDVRTEQGDDAGSLFVDMLKGLGAKIMGRLGHTCTHIVYKNGLPNTLTRYRMLNDPKPVVVGIAWVVECAEKRTRVDEERFKIDVDLIDVAGGNHKRRRSMLPKHLIPSSPGPGLEVHTHMSFEADDDDDEGAGGFEGSSPSHDLDINKRSSDDDLPPLERARRRRSILPGGQTRLVP